MVSQDTQIDVIDGGDGVTVALGESYEVEGVGSQIVVAGHST